MKDLNYRTLEYHKSKVHIITIDMDHHSIRPVMADESFPFQRRYPIHDAIAQGAIAAMGDGFNMTWWHHQGAADQPLHSLVVDREIWTTGVGAGGYGFLISDRNVWAQRNRVQIHLWRPDKSTLEIERVNCGHDGEVVAFTPRGGTNQRPAEGCHYVVLSQPSWWVKGKGDAQSRQMVVSKVDAVTPPPVEADTVVLESRRWGMKLREGDKVVWVQRIGEPGVRHIISGWPQLVRDGQNIVPTLDLHGVASHGPDNWFIRKNPRSVLGISKNHRKAFFVVVEGRIEDSVGLRLKEMASMLVDEGVHDAVNSDGGGSAFLWLKEGGLVADSCYGDGTLEGLRPDHYSTAVF